MNEELQMKQNEFDELNAKRKDMEDELAVSKIKQQACMLNKKYIGINFFKFLKINLKTIVVLHERLSELEQRKARLETEMQEDASAGDQRERLLTVVKQHNEAITVMERQLGYFKKIYFKQLYFNLI
jgi:hypothetical protein